jgi:outer membrane protein OmpA-like peptidoglycan-associated protein
MRLRTDAHREGVLAEDSDKPRPRVAYHLTGGKDDETWTGIGGRARPGRCGGSLGVVRDILFDFDKSDIRASEAGKAPEIAAYMKANPSIQVGIDGYADPRGTNQYNLALSQRRS